MLRCPKVEVKLCPRKDHRGSGNEHCIVYRPLIRLREQVTPIAAIYEFSEAIRHIEIRA
jgi:hypothetical protein